MADVVVSQITIIKGSDRQFSVRVIAKESQDPFNFNGVTEIKAIFQQDNTIVPAIPPVEISFTGGQITPDSTSQGKLTLFLNEIQTGNLMATDCASFELLITIGSQLTIVQFIDALNIVQRLFPGVN